jgi:hypothetical protein
MDVTSLHQLPLTNLFKKILEQEQEQEEGVKSISTHILNSLSLFILHFFQVYEWGWENN